MKKTIFLLSISLCFITTACDKATIDSCKKQINISFGKEEDSKFALSQIFGQVSYLQLDSTCLMGRIDEIRSFDKTYYICDKSEGAVHLFDISGKHITSIKNRGRAKNEYIVLSDFDVSPVNGDVHIYDSGSHRFLVYSKNGTFINSFHTDDVIRDFAILPNGDYLLYTPDKNGDARRGLWRTDKTGNFKEQLVKIDNEFQYGGIYPQYLTRIDNRSIGLMGGEDSDNFYVITEDSITIQLHINYNISIPHKLQKERNIDFTKHKGEVYTKNTYFESHRWLWFVTTNFESKILCFYDKTNDVCYNISKEQNLIEDINIFGSPLFLYEDKMISVIYASQILSSQTLRDKFPNVIESSNPILEIIDVTR